MFLKEKLGTAVEEMKCLPQLNVVFRSGSLTNMEFCYDGSDYNCQSRYEDTD